VGLLIFGLLGGQHDSSLAVEPGELKPGLVAVYQEPAGIRKGDTPRSIVRLESTVAVLLDQGETVHPRLETLGSARWSGYVNVVRAGTYRFSATLRQGTLVVCIDGKEVLRGTAGEQETTMAGPEIPLEGGVRLLEVIWTCNSTPTRCTLWWEGPGFIREPLNGHYLGHLPSQRPPEYRTDLQREHGRFLFEELACIRCHRPAQEQAGAKPDSGDKVPPPLTAAARLAQSLTDRTGPKLTGLGRRVYAGWLDRWLADPQKSQPHATMPRLFGEDAVGQAERYAIIQFFLQQAGQGLPPFRPPLLADNSWKQSINRGQTLFFVTGCAACHQEQKTPEKNEEEAREPLRPEDYLYGLGTSQGSAAKYVLGALGSKTRPEVLTDYLRNPLALHPGGRMPQMQLSPQEATDLARYLCLNRDDSIPTDPPPVPSLSPQKLFATHGEPLPAGWDQLPIEKQWAAAGQMLLTAKGCVNCHEIEVNGKPLPARVMVPLERILAAPQKGCLAAPQGPGKEARYSLSQEQRQALQAFVHDGWQVSSTQAPAYQARVALRRYGCLNCHVRDGEGGIPNPLAERMRLLEKAENADDIRPPVLTGIGHKARRSWLQAVLLEGQRARPWMQLRMPQYGSAHVGALPHALPRLEGMAPDDTIYKVPLSTELISSGRQIIGKSGLGCISCHDISGIANPGTRGPDLATIQQRVRYEWYERWLHQPLRMAPGTRMPQAFVDGQSTLKTVLGGNPQAQAQAMWAYLSLGPGLPLPEGLEPPKGLILTVREHPELLRTFLPETGARAIAVGYPQGVHLAFSAEQCRLVYGWSGNFLDVSPVWNNRGGAPAKLLGPKFWTAPPVHPWGWTASPAEPPPFEKRMQDPAWGAPLPQEPPRVYTGPRFVRFDGYTLDGQSRPAFRYAIQTNPDGKEEVQITETPLPLRSTVATGLARKFQWNAPPHGTLWFLAGTTSSPPRLQDLATGRIRPWNLSGEGADLAAQGVRVLLPQSGGGVLAIEVQQAPAGTRWQWIPQNNGGSLLIRFPAHRQPWQGEATVVIWSLPRDEEALLRDLGK
jgi:cytochrome c553